MSKLSFKYTLLFLLFQSLLSLTIINSEELIINPLHPLLIQNFEESSDTTPFNGKCYYKNLTTNDESSIKIAHETINNNEFVGIDYDVRPKGSQVAYTIEFKGADFTYFDKIKFALKGDNEEGFNPKIRLELSSWNEKIYTVISEIKPDWSNFEINLSSFEGKQFQDFNWESVFYLTFIFDEQQSTIKKGKYYLDDIYLIPKRNTSISLENLKKQNHLKPRSRIFKFPNDIIKNINLNSSDDELLRQIAKDTWFYFTNAIDKNTYMVMDQLHVSNNTDDCVVADYTNITNIGLELLCILAAYDFNFLSEYDAYYMIEKLLSSIEKIKKWNGLAFNYYRTKDAVVANQYISSVDNGWLAAGLICLRNSFKGKYSKITSKLLTEMKLDKVYNSKIGQLSLGYEYDKEKYSPYNYGLLNTEPRVTSLIGIGKGDIPKDHWFKLCRTLPPDWNWQTQKPIGKIKKIDGVTFFGGYYTYENEKYVPSWGGSMFETLMPLIVINEQKWAPKSLGKNDETIAKLHIKYSKENKFNYWGYSPCSTPKSDSRWWGYHEFGIPILGASGKDKVYSPYGIVTPHAMLLPLMVGLKDEVMTNLKALLKEYPEIYGEFGLYDSVDTINNIVTKKYLALDQAMLFISICNYLNKGSMQKRFEQDEIFKNIKYLISQENFFE